nr:unnamed protein product [Callosobruchus analis]
MSYLCSNSSQNIVSCSECRKSFHASCVNLTATEVNFFAEDNEKWLCPVCSKQGRTTRSGSTSSVIASISGQPVTTDQLTLIMNQLLSIASDVKDVMICQTRLSNDIAECKSLIEQHSDKISQHDISIQTCLADIQSLRSAQENMSSNLTAIEQRFTGNCYQFH